MAETIDMKPLFEAALARLANAVEENKRLEALGAETDFLIEKLHDLAELVEKEDSGSG